MRTVVAPGPMSTIHVAPDSAAALICAGQSTGVVSTAAAREWASAALIPHWAAHSSTRARASASMGEWNGT